MNRKRCSRCGKELLLIAFAWQNRAAGKRSSWCKACYNVWWRGYYARNTEKVKTRARNQSRRNAAWLREYKAKLRCNRCGMDNPATLQFHHLSRDEKDIDVAAAVNRGWALARILREIEKCEVLCANCHSIEHAAHR